MENSMNGLMQTALENIRSMVDVNTIIGDALHLANGTVVLPVSRVSFGFAAGGNSGDVSDAPDSGTFGGGTGAGVSVKPVGFLICGEDNVRFLGIEKNSLAEQLADYVPQTIELLREFVNKKQESSERPDTVQ